MKQVSLDQLSARQFAEVARTKFQVLVKPGEAVPLELISVTPQSAGSSDFEGFSLLFNGPPNRPLGQQTYRFEHEGLGAFDLFIVPVSADGAGRQYEAVFNRRLPPGNV